MPQPEINFSSDLPVFGKHLECTNVMYLHACKHCDGELGGKEALLTEILRSLSSCNTSVPSTRAAAQLVHSSSFRTCLLENMHLYEET